MKKLLRVMLALSLCAAALCVPAAAEETETKPEAPLNPWEHPAPVRVWGKVSPWDGEGIFLKNGDKDDPMNEVILHVGEDTAAVDASTGLPLDLKTVKEGDTLYAWIGPAAAMSLPPQVFPTVIVGNVPADANPPELCEIAQNVWRFAPEDHRNPLFNLAGRGTLEVNDKTVYTPWRTRQIVTIEDLIPGTRVLVWKDAEGVAEKVLVFPYAYQGYVCMMATMHGNLLCLNGDFTAGEDAPQFQCKKLEDGTTMAPIRALAEAAGYEVRWDKDLGAVVSLNGETVFSVMPGADVIQTPEGETGVSAPAILENGVTYLPAEDLCYWLNLYYTIA